MRYGNVATHLRDSHCGPKKQRKAVVDAYSQFIICDPKNALLPSLLGSPLNILGRLLLASSAKSRNASVFRSAGMKCANTATEHTIGNRQRKIESTGTMSGFKLSSNQPAYRNIPLSITLIESKTNVAKTKKRRVQA
jgi:hypothetical protein